MDVFPQKPALCCALLEGYAVMRITFSARLYLADAQGFPVAGAQHTISLGLLDFDKTEIPIRP
jgi:hypothetical protein